MPNIGDIVHGKDLGKDGTNKSRKYVFVMCPDCGKTRWLCLRREVKSNTKLLDGKARCQKCCGIASNYSGRLPHGKMEKSHRWKGGRSIKGQYVYVRMYDNDPFFCMAIHCKRGGGDILEHRLIMARHLNRVLAPQEHVHHLNGDKQDNRIENLELVSRNNHHLYNVMCSHCEVRKENRQLKREIELLKTQITPMI